jgi:hypothetical protein
MILRSSVRPVSLPKQLSDEWRGFIRILERYVSGLLARSIVERTLERCPRQRGESRSAHALRVIEESRIAIRLFCEADRLPSLMDELSAYCRAQE